MEKFVLVTAALEPAAAPGLPDPAEMTPSMSLVLVNYSQAVSLKRIADALEKLTTTKGLLQLAGDMIEEADAIKALAEKLR